MNCANHADASALAYCRTCGKPLCATCVRDVRGVIYCENCIAARLEGTAPPAAFVPPTAHVVPPAAGPAAPPPYSGGPNPTVAGILAGFFPFGVGAVYNTQYAKGLAHLIIFILLIIGMTQGETASLFSSLAFAFFYFYQIIDAVRSARAIQMGQPAPDPFGVAQTFTAGEKLDTSKVPAGAVILIGLGILFLLHTMGLFEFGLTRYWPLILIIIGAWLFARRWGLLGSCQGCTCERCRTRHLIGPALLVTIGALFLLRDLGVARLHRTWPAILLVIGLVKLLQSNASSAGHVGPPPPLPGGTPPTGIASGEVQPPSTEVKNV